MSQILTQQRAHPLATIVLDVLAIAFVVGTPAITHLLPLQWCLFESMRLFVLTSLIQKLLYHE